MKYLAGFSGVGDEDICQCEDGVFITSGALVHGGVLRLRCALTSPSMITMPMPGRSPNRILSRIVFPSERCALSIITNVAVRPIAIKPQSSLRILAVLPVAKQIAV